ncbi:DUF262 domain-containing protein [Microbulbifer sp. YPW16]|uniref:DUF262 domain-containing protein n=1 Tax=Microbulbifer sp. YPW16 TaxID=2904242 RepID=UPI001E450440|nr:DUF262 domain-containing protein [Microbulbifer sp. YPW16]UHQ56643.1 DUF262 domain-containing protein [Microbulbifer sp. YPW16]
MAEVKYELRTNATNRRIREIISAVRTETLLPRPDFQRRLVWTNKDKVAFIETILQHLPFPEIYVCAGAVDPTTAQGTEWLVDGQQRVSTIVAYFNGDKDLKLPSEVPAYEKLDPDTKTAFLEYTVVVRDLGNVPVDYVKEVFQRINSTKYGLNAMELANARYDGAIKKTAETLAAHPFFSEHGVFKISDIRRMGDISFQLSVLITIEQGYFDDSDAHDAFLERYNDEYPRGEEFQYRVTKSLEFIDSMSLDPKSRWFKKADVFSLIIEIDRALHDDKLTLEPSEVREILENFENHLERIRAHEEVEGISDSYRNALANYAHAAAQGSNHRKSRTVRGETIEKLLRNQLQQ